MKVAPDGTNMDEKGDDPADYQSPTYSAPQPKHQPIVRVPDDKSGANAFCSVVLTVLSVFLIMITFPFSLCACVKIVQEYERAIIFRLGRALPGARGPGLFFIIPCVDDLIKVDLRTISFDVPPQEILTKDSVTVAVDAVVYYKINNPMISVVNVENAPSSTRLLSQTTLRNVLGSKTLAEILAEREQISAQMQEILDIGTDPWGVKVERVEIKDVRLPVQLQRAMATEAEAAREAKAKVIAAEGEFKASQALKDASDIISESDNALQLRYLQTLTQISAEKNSTIIFPLPIDLLGGLSSRFGHGSHKGRGKKYQDNSGTLFSEVGGRSQATSPVDDGRRHSKPKGRANSTPATPQGPFPQGAAPEEY